MNSSTPDVPPLTCQVNVLRHGRLGVGQFCAAVLVHVTVLRAEKWSVRWALPTLPHACFPVDLVCRSSVPKSDTCRVRVAVSPWHIVWVALECGASRRDTLARPADRFEVS